MAHEQTLRLVSPSISNESRLPRKYTGDGQGAVKDVSPPLEWYGVPDGAKSLAIVVQDLDGPEDPAAPNVPWTHWVLVNIPPTVKGLPEGFSGKDDSEIKEGINDWKVPGWRGPLPPSAGHRIEFRMYALDQMMHLGNKVTKKKLLDSIDGHILAEAEFVAVF